jgi:tyrosine aminotransferase
MIKPSKKAQRTHNPIRHIVDNLNPPQNHPKKMLNLALGDPTVHGNLFCPTVLQETIHDLLSRSVANGYAPSPGIPAARRAIAQYQSTGDYTVAEDDVFIGSGCSGALELALSCLLDEGDNVLVPKPAFPLYQVITESLGGQVKYYPLIAEKNWEADLEAMDAAIDGKTKAIVINNPSNPCGSNFSSQHLLGIAAVARKHSLPIIADEIYEHCVFNGEFTPMHINSGDVPVLSVGGLAKEFVIPGWRVGWLILHDKKTGRLDEFKNGIKSLTQLIVGKSGFCFFLWLFSCFLFLLFVISFHFMCFIIISYLLSLVLLFF